jgi:hypothetical protein
VIVVEHIITKEFKGDTMGMDTRSSQFIAFFIFISLLFIPGYETAMAIEEASYTVIEKNGDFELRQYVPQIVAETIIEGDFDKVGNEGFSRLFGYISGNNTKKQSISMTAPVSQEAGSEKIPMTAPVNQEKVGDKWHISFLMPSNYTLETLPEPTDKRIILKLIPSRNVAAITYSGTWSRSRYEEHKAILEKAMSNRKLKPVGEYIFARYNPPFMPWFLRRNEVLVTVELSHE